MNWQCYHVTVLSLLCAHYIWLNSLTVRDSVSMEFKEADQVCFVTVFSNLNDRIWSNGRNDKSWLINTQTLIWNLYLRYHENRTRRRTRSKMVSSLGEKGYWERRPRMAWDITKVSVLDSKLPRRLLKVHMLTRNALSPVMCQSVVVSWRPWLSPLKWREPLSSVVITFSMYLSTDVSRRDTRTYQSTALLVSWTLERAML